jgi:hypothetical protein
MGTRRRFFNFETLKLCCARALLRCRCLEIAFTTQKFVESDPPDVNSVVPNVYDNGPIKIQLPQSNLRVFGKLPERAWTGMPLNLGVKHDTPPVARTYSYSVASGTLRRRRPMEVVEIQLTCVSSIATYQDRFNDGPSPAFIFV